ncbi:MAG: hypothetical protein LBS54_08480 [Dysgonamonadaceae bacterium]|jgi:hypothetical protein|nr:hypothetical protein [Dysgonamonadaceae bacterium]
MYKTNIQDRFLNEIKKKLPANNSLAYAIEDTLHVSLDSVYRRIRGTTLINVEEIELLCRRFGVSMDALLSENSDNVLFRQAQTNDNEQESLKLKLAFIVEFMEILAAGKDCYIKYPTLDIPFFHYAQFPELMLFRIYVWHRSINKWEKMTFEKFLETYNSNENTTFFKKIADASKKIQITEIWTLNTLSPLINYLEYYSDLNLFEDNSILASLCGQTLELIEYIRNCTENKCQDFSGKKTPFELYLSSIDFSNSTMLSGYNDIKTVSLMPLPISLMYSDDKKLSNINEESITDLISKSNSINGASEKERLKFFSKLKEKVLKLNN